MPNTYSKGYKLFFVVTFMLLFGFLILSSRAEEHGEEDIVKLVENDHKSSENKDEEKSSQEEVIELEGDTSSELSSQVQNPEQVYEACMSLQESFEKECKIESVNFSLYKLVRACSDTLLDSESVVKIASEITEALSDSSLSENNECTTMIFTSSLFISSNAQAEEEEEEGSLEAESLETDDSLMESEFDNN